MNFFKVEFFRDGNYVQESFEHLGDACERCAELKATTDDLDMLDVVIECVQISE